MHIAPLPENEVARLKALYDYSILDTEPEVAFDELTRLASNICNTPIALVSLVDAERQWFKSKVGLQATETTRDRAFCAHTILQSDVLVVPDALADERFADNPLVTAEPHVRFYAGAPLITSEGVAIGSLCTIDHQPRQLSAEQLEALQILSRQVVRLIEQRRNMADLARISLQAYETGEQLRLSQERFELAVEGSSAGLWDWDIRTDTIFLSSRWKGMLGYADHEISNTFQDWVKCVHPLDSERFLKEISAYLDRTQPTFELEYRLQRKNGTDCWVLCRGIALWDEQGRAYRMAGSHTDISARKRAETELKESEAQLRKRSYQLELALFALKQTQAQSVQSAKMAALGQLVAGLAHEINNPIGFIKGNIQCAEQYIEDLMELLQLYQTAFPDSTSEIRARAEEIDLAFLLQDLPKLLNSLHVGTDRIYEIVQSFRTFSRLDESDVKSVNIHDGIDSTLMILQSRLKGSKQQAPIFVIKKYGNLPKIECYAGQLNQVFMNIIANSIDALQEQDLEQPDRRAILPSITICTEILEPDWIRIRIRDNGPGMTSEVKQQLFEPFFTTKQIGKGTGLGMSISYQIVTEKHGGVLQCFSEPGEGAEFVIDLPIKQERLTCDKQQIASSKNSSSLPMSTP